MKEMKTISQLLGATALDLAFNYAERALENVSGHNVDCLAIISKKDFVTYVHLLREKTDLHKVRLKELLGSVQLSQPGARELIKGVRLTNPLLKDAPDVEVFTQNTFVGSALVGKTLILVTLPPGSKPK